MSELGIEHSRCLWDSAGGMFGFSQDEEVTVTLGAEAGDDVEMDHALC